MFFSAGKLPDSVSMLVCCSAVMQVLLFPIRLVRVSQTHPLFSYSRLATLRVPRIICIASWHLAFKKNNATPTPRFKLFARVSSADGLSYIDQWCGCYSQRNETCPLQILVHVLGAPGPKEPVGPEGARRAGKKGRNGPGFGRDGFHFSYE